MAALYAAARAYADGVPGGGRVGGGDGGCGGGGGGDFSIVELPVALELPAAVLFDKGGGMMGGMGASGGGMGISRAVRLYWMLMDMPGGGNGSVGLYGRQRT